MQRSNKSREVSAEKIKENSRYLPQNIYEKDEEYLDTRA